MEAPSIKTKPQETTEEMHTSHHNSRFREKLGPFSLGLGDLEDQKRGLHPAVDKLGLKKKKNSKRSMTLPVE